VIDGPNLKQAVMASPTPTLNVESPHNIPMQALEIDGQVSGFGAAEMSSK